VTYHASGFAYKEEVEADDLSQAEERAFARLDEPRLRITVEERVLVLLTAQVGAVQIEPKAAPPLRVVPPSPAAGAPRSAGYSRPVPGATPPGDRPERGGGFRPGGGGPDREGGPGRGGRGDGGGGPRQGWRGPGGSGGGGGDKGRPGGGGPRPGGRDRPDGNGPRPGGGYRGGGGGPGGGNRRG
jgi:hypothetical protein